MRTTDGLRKWAKENRGNKGQGRKVAIGKSRLISESAKLAQCARCGEPKWRHEQSYGLFPDHPFEDATR